MRKRKILLIFTLVLMLGQIFFLHDRVLASEKKNDKTEKTLEELQVEQISKTPVPSPKVTEKQQKKELNTETKIESKTKSKDTWVHKLKKYSLYILVFVIYVILSISVFVDWKKHKKKHKKKQRNIGLRSKVFLVNKSEKIAIPIHEKEKVTIGRKDKADVALSEDEELADIHMALWYDQGRYWIENQTEKELKFNGREIEKGEIRALYNHAVLEIGNKRYWFTEEE